MSNTPTAAPAKPGIDTLAQQLNEVINAPGERTREMQGQKVEATVAEVIQGLVSQMAQQGGVNIETLNINVGKDAGQSR